MSSVLPTIRESAVNDHKRALERRRQTGLRGNAAFVFAALGDDWGTTSFESHGASDSKDVQLGREHNDICDRLRSEIDKARKEYDRRFRAIQNHPVDYFHRRMAEIPAGGNIEALDEYPYPSPALRH